MNNSYATRSTDPRHHAPAIGEHTSSHPAQVQRVLRNTYALLAMTLLFSAGVAVTTLTLQLPAPGWVVTLAGYFGLLFAVFKLQNSAWALPAASSATPSTWACRCPAHRPLRWTR